jgi:hypothetical protein
MTDITSKLYAGVIFLIVNLYIGGRRRRNVLLFIFHPHIESQLSNCSDSKLGMNFKQDT